MSKQELKQQAKRLRAHLAAQGTPMSHGAALEAVAAQHGLRDWNTAAATLPERETPPEGQSPETFPRRPLPFIGDAVKGTYLGTPFAGTVKGLRKIGENRWEIAVRFNQELEVVKTERLSVKRRQISAIIDDDGVSVLPIGRPTPVFQLDLAPVTP